MGKSNVEWTWTTTNVRNNLRSTIISAFSLPFDLNGIDWTFAQGCLTDKGLTRMQLFDSHMGAHSNLCALLLHKWVQSEITLRRWQARHSHLLYKGRTRLESTWLILSLMTRFQTLSLMTRFWHLDPKWERTESESSDWTRELCWSLEQSPILHNDWEPVFPTCSVTNHSRSNIDGYRLHLKCRPCHVWVLSHTKREGDHHTA